MTVAWHSLIVDDVRKQQTDIKSKTVKIGVQQSTFVNYLKDSKHEQICNEEKVQDVLWHTYPLFINFCSNTNAVLQMLMSVDVFVWVFFLIIFINVEVTITGEQIAPKDFLNL